MLRGTVFKPKAPPPRQREERAYKTPSVAVGRFRLAAQASDEVRASPKENALECEAYRRLVASLPCINCSIVGHSQAAHPPPTGKGRKEDDRRCVPLCAPRPGIPGCHYQFDQYQLMPHDAAVEQMETWGRQVRAVIVGFRLWPASLPRWAEGE